MDTSEGRMVMADTPQELEKLKVIYPKYKGVFTVGETLECKGSRFLVKDISPFGIKLKILKQP